MRQTTSRVLGAAMQQGLELLEAISCGTRVRRSATDCTRVARLRDVADQLASDRSFTSQEVLELIDGLGDVWREEVRFIEDSLHCDGSR